MKCVIQLEFFSRGPKRLPLQSAISRNMGPKLGIMVVGLISVLSATAGGIYRDGAGARAVALGGATVGKPDTALEALQGNPAGLSLLSQAQLQFGLGVGLPRGEFSNDANSGAELKDRLAGGPEVAFALPLAGSRIALGWALVPDAALGGEWRYEDAPGGINNTSYGRQKHRSEITALRTAVAASVALSDTVAVGGGAGLVYNRNQLHAPYIFQTYPALRGFKTLLDLETDGFGGNAQIGLIYRPTENVSMGLSYQSRTRVTSHGAARGDAGVQLANLGLGGAQPDFRYDAEVDNVFPQLIAAGAHWRITEQLRGVAQVDWINWADAFDALEIRLNNGSNPDINGVLGTANIYDVVPLRWKDQFVYRVGLEYQATETLALRAGYTYSKSPVPDRTLTPLTAAIMEHKLSGGIGWTRERYFLDAAYQYSLPATQRVGSSGLQAGEYSRSRTEVSVHLLAVTLGMNF